MSPPDCFPFQPSTRVVVTWGLLRPLFPFLSSPSTCLKPLGVQHLSSLARRPLCHIIATSTDTLSGRRPWLMASTGGASIVNDQRYLIFESILPLITMPLQQSRTSQHHPGTGNSRLSLLPKGHYPRDPLGLTFPFRRALETISLRASRRLRFATQLRYNSRGRRHIHRDPNYVRYKAAQWRLPVVVVERLFSRDQCHARQGVTFRDRSPSGPTTQNNLISSIPEAANAAVETSCMVITSCPRQELFRTEKSLLMLPSTTRESGPPITLCVSRHPHCFPSSTILAQLLVSRRRLPVHMPTCTPSEPSMLSGMCFASRHRYPPSIDCCSRLIGHTDILQARGSNNYHASKPSILVGK